MPNPIRSAENETRPREQQGTAERRPFFRALGRCLPESKKTSPEISISGLVAVYGACAAYKTNQIFMMPPMLALVTSLE
ncbi:hypothetical protein CDO73_14295 [Saccharibacillus sp. O23]|nr:hypothetical protein CDO73_14295 [Saccharibacillus sp. O23]